MLPRDPEFSSRLDFADTLALQSLPLSADPLHAAFPPDAAVQHFLCCPAGQLLLARRADAIRDQADLIHFNAQAVLLDLDPAVQRDPRFVEVFSGIHKMPGMDPIVMLYAGHQFGHYVPQLGDGCADYGPLECNFEQRKVTRRTEYSEVFRHPDILSSLFPRMRDRCPKNNYLIE